MPITDAGQDLLGRAPLALAMAEQATAAPKDQGLVIGLTGAWGSGKTSVLNMMRQSIKADHDGLVLHFNPWLFGGADELVGRFLEELAAQLRDEAERKNNAAKASLLQASERIGSYAESLEPLGWLPVVGAWATRIASVGKWMKKANEARRKQPSVTDRRDAVCDALRALDRRVVVVIDDLDRIEGGQIRDMVRLVKLVGDFPNVTYVLSYDAEPVARAVGGDDVEAGSAYLEKIVQIVHPVPDPGPVAVRNILAKELQALLDAVETGPFHTADWQNVAPEGLFPLFSNVRDVRRYLNALPVTLRVIGGDVAVVDVLALEAMRIFIPGSYARLPDAVAALCGPASPSLFDRADRDADGAQIQAIIDAGGTRISQAREILRRLFPGAHQAITQPSLGAGLPPSRQGLRVAHPDVLRTYLQRALPEGVVSGAAVEDFVAALSDQASLQQLAESLAPADLQRVIVRLLDYAPAFGPDAAKPATVVLYNQLGRLPEGRLNLGEDAEMQVGRIVLAVLRPLENEGERLAVVESALPEIDTLTGRMELIDTVGHRENTGHRLIEQADSDRLYRDLADQVLAASPAHLATERQLAQLFIRLLQERPDVTDFVRESCIADDVLIRLLRSALGEATSQTVGEYATRRRAAMPWSMFTEWLGDAALTHRIDKLIAGTDALETRHHRDQLAVETAAKYASGQYQDRAAAEDDDPG